MSNEKYANTQIHKNAKIQIHKNKVLERPNMCYIFLKAGCSRISNMTTDPDLTTTEPMITDPTTTRPSTRDPTITDPIKADPTTDHLVDPEHLV